MNIKDFEDIEERLQRKPRRTLIILAVVAMVSIALSLLNEGIRRAVFRDGERQHPQPPTAMDPRFAQVLRDHPELASQLGDVVGNPLNIGATLQPFGAGFMLWRYDDPDVLLVCFEKAEQECHAEGHIALRQDELTSFSNLPVEVRSLFNPTGGFLQVWLRQGLQTSLGAPLSPEKALGLVSQKFERGLMLHDVPWFRRTDRQFIEPRGVSPVLVISGRDRRHLSWLYVG